MNHHTAKSSSKVERTDVLNFSGGAPKHSLTKNNTIW